MVGLEIIVEPDVVPKGTVDLKKLDAAPGTKPPLRRIEADGRVFMLATEEVPTGALSQPAQPAPVTVPPEDEEPLGMKLRKKSIHSDVAMPPRPASAETSASGRLAREPLPDDDYETTMITGGLGSSLWSLVKVTAVVAFFTLAVVFTWLKWNNLLPWGASTPEQVAIIPPPLPTRPSKPESVAPPTTASQVAKSETVAHTATDSATSVALGVNPEGAAKATDKKPAASGDIENDSDYDIKKIERLRAEAVRLDHAGRLDEALAKLDELLKIKPHDGDALFRRALVIHKKGDYPNAIKAYELAAQYASPHDARSWNNLGLCHEALGELSAARAAYERGLQQDPEDPNVLTNMGRLEEDHDWKSALVLYEKALERDSRHPQARYHRAAILALREDKVAEGKKDLEQLVGKDSPVRAEALDALGKIAIREGKFADAQKLLKDALDARPALDDARLYLGVALLEQGEAQPAVDELKSFVEKNPRSADGWKTLGAALVRLDQLQDAKQAYEKALAINDKDADTLYNYALCAERFGNFLFAIQEYERVVAIDPHHWKALTNLGRLYRNAGREQKALDYFDKAIAVRPKEPELYLHRANSLVALHRDADARYALEEFVRLARPDDPRVPQARRAITSTGALKPAGGASSAPVNNSGGTGDRPGGF